jgi:predicted DNA-binding protein (UPF0278 family)
MSVRCEEDRDDGLKAIESFMADWIMIGERLDELRKRYPDKYVAAKNGKIVDSDEDLDALLSRLEEKGIDPSRTPVEFISRKPELLIV